MASKQTRKLQLIFSWTLSLIGLVIQFYQISDQYLRYGTVTHLSIFYPKEVVPPNVAFCSSTLEVNISNVPKLDELIYFIYFTNRKRFAYKKMKLDDSNKEAFDEHLTKTLEFDHYFKRRELCFTIHVRDPETFVTRFITSGKYPFIFYELKIKGDFFRNTSRNFFYLKNFDQDFYGLIANIAQDEHNQTLTNLTASQLYHIRLIASNY